LGSADLPADADASGLSELPDKSHLQCIVDTTCSPEILVRHDQDRDGNVDTADVTRITELLNGTNTTQAWVNVSLPGRP